MPDVRPPDGAARGLLSVPTAMRLLALVLVSLLALTATGCGGDDDLRATSPRTQPDLTIPTTPDDAASADADAGADEDTSTTDTDAADASGDAATGGTADGSATGGTATPAPTPTPEPTAPETGGTAEPAAPEQEPAPEDTGGAGAGDLSDFCAENPGAC